MICHYRLDKLAKSFCDNIAGDKEDPFISDIVVTQSASMDSYLNQTLAKNNGIAVGIDYLHPRQCINEIFSRCGIDTSDDFCFSKDIFVWNIYALLPKLLSEPNFQVIKNYIEDSKQKDFRTYQLASMIASIFDNYVAYRGEWLEKWQNNMLLGLGEHEKWQANLWRKLTEKIKFTRVSERLINEIISNEDCLKKLPEKISIFGLSNLPADFIRFFESLQEKTSVDFYYLIYSLGYWGDINKRDAYIDNHQNQLLASWGSLGKDFLNLLLDSNFEAGGDEINDNFDTSSVLNALQADILSNKNASDNDRQLQNKVMDGSIVINSCYSKMREVEVLHDQILHLLNKDNTKLDEIIIMTPNIEDYTSYIQAVFDGLENKIPFSIADNSIVQESKIAEVFLKIISLSGSKMCGLDIYEIISSESISENFSLTTNDLDIIHNLLVESNVAWGENAEHRKEFLGREYHDCNTWEFSFDRLLSGYAFDTNEVVDETLPIPLKDDEGIIVGKLKTICDLLFSYSNKLSEKRTPDAWQTTFLNIINSFFGSISPFDSAKTDELDKINAAVGFFFKNIQKSNLSEELSLDIIKEAIKNEFANESASKGFFTGKLTFCKLLPMRNIPFNMVFILGLDEGEFPRIDKKCGFDLMVENSRNGDRSMQKDDRYIFLETLMSCKEKLYLSFVGQSNSDNETIPPSIVISELIEYIKMATDLTEEDLITKHALHGFNPKYFLGKKGFYSYNKSNYKAVKNISSGTIKKADFCEGKLPNDNSVKKLDLSFNDFVNFFVSPAKYFLKNRLNINLYQEDLKELKDCEPFELDSLTKYKLKDDYLKAIKLGEDDNFDIKSKKTGEIPFGIWGDEILRDAEEKTNQIYGRISEEGNRLNPTEYIIIDSMEIDGVEVSLSGSFDSLHSEKQVFARPSGIKNKDKLKGWLWHQLLINCNLEQKETIILGVNEKNKLEEISINSKNTESIKELLAIIIYGLQKPLPLFIESSYAFMKSFNDTQDESKAATVASKKWNSSNANDFSYESKNIENKICFGNESPFLNEDYAEDAIGLSMAIYSEVVEL